MDRSEPEYYICSDRWGREGAPKILHNKKKQNKFALLWGEAQLYLPYACLYYRKK